MDIVFWIILIVLIVGVVWWLLNRSNTSSTGDSTPVRTDGGLAGGSAAASAEAAGTAGIPSAAGFGAAEPPAPTTADEAPVRSRTAEPQEAGAGHDVRMEPNAAGSTDTAGSAETAAADAPERVPSEKPSSPESAGAMEPPTREEQSAAEQPARPEEPVRSEELAGPEEPTTQEPGRQESVSRQADEAEWETQWSEASAPTQPAASHRPAGDASNVVADAPLPEGAPAQDAAPVHHPEYTEPHAPTLPGAETAAAEAAPEPTGHLAADQPYGAGSASPGPDGSGPADFDVKADAGTMVYYEEGHPDYEQTKADVWFESAAHAEAAGFRAPRRTRI